MTITVEVKKEGNEHYIFINNVKKIPISDFKDINTGSPNNISLEKCIEQQQIINFLDCVKDGKPVVNPPKLQQLGLFTNKVSEKYRTAGETVEYKDSELHKYEKIMTNNNLDNITNHTWSRLSKRKNKGKSKDYEGLKEKINVSSVFYDAGLGAENYITENYQIVNTIGTYMDPAEKPKPHTTFPSLNENILFEPSFMELFGFNNSIMNATPISAEKFKYQLFVDTGNIENINNNIVQYDGKGDDINMERYYKGNNTKNNYIKDESGNSNEKRKLIILKEWGDKLQVLNAFVYSLYKNTSNYVVCTGDLVVFLLCILLGVNCVMNNVKDTNNNKKEIDVMKSTTIKHYLSKDKSEVLKEVKQNTLKEVQEIFTFNKKYIKFITILEEDWEITYIKPDKHSDIYRVQKQFFTIIKEDLIKIQNYLESQKKSILENINKNSNLSDLKEYIVKLKETCTFNNFLRKDKNIIKLVANAKQYSKNTGIYSNMNDTLNLPLKKTFYETLLLYAVEKNGKLIQKPFSGGVFYPSRNTMKRPRSLSKPNSKSPSKTQKRSIEYKQTLKKLKNETRTLDRQFTYPQEFIDLLNTPEVDETSFDTEPVYYYDEEGVIDLNAALRNDVYNVLKRIGKEDAFFTIYNSILYELYYHNGFPEGGYFNSSYDKYESNTEKLIRKILNDYPLVETSEKRVSVKQTHNISKGYSLKTNRKIKRPTIKTRRGVSLKSRKTLNNNSVFGFFGY